MARYVVDIEKKFGEEYWTNVYHCEAADRADAEDFAVDVANREKTVNTTSVLFTKARVRPDTGPGAVGSVVALGFTGTITAYTNNLPLFCCMRVDFLTSTGRPSRKYLRGPLDAGQVSGNGGIIAVNRTNWTTSYVTPMLADTRFVDPQGTPFVGGIILAAIQMRQLRRGSKRNTPVLP